MANTKKLRVNNGERSVPDILSTFVYLFLSILCVNIEKRGVGMSNNITRTVASPSLGGGGGGNLNKKIIFSCNKKSCPFNLYE